MTSQTLGNHQRQLYQKAIGTFSWNLRLRNEQHRATADEKCAYSWRGEEKVNVFEKTGHHGAPVSQHKGHHAGSVNLSKRDKTDVIVADGSSKKKKKKKKKKEFANNGDLPRRVDKGVEKVGQGLVSLRSLAIAPGGNHLLSLATLELSGKFSRRMKFPSRKARLSPLVEHELACDLLDGTLEPERARRMRAFFSFLFFLSFFSPPMR